MAPLSVPVDEFTLASRLSYFLWSSTPDDELLNLAEKGQLRAHLDEQVKRLLASPKAQALVDNFAGQWLQFRSLATFSPDAKVLQNYYNAWPELCEEMEQETGLFFNHIMREDHSILDFLTADYTFVNEDLANYYGLPGVTGEHFRKVSLAGTPRRGVLTQGSTLILTSNPTRTSPVKRGKWVLDNPARHAPAPRRRPTSRCSTRKPSLPARCASRWSSTAPTRPAPPAMRAWTPLALDWKTLTPPANGAPATARRPLTPPARS